MASEIVYCAINKKREIQWVGNGSKRMRYYTVERYCRNAVEEHNMCFKDDPWKVKKFKLVGVRE